MLQLKLASARRELVRRADVDALIDCRCHPDRLVQPACTLRAAWRSCDPAQHRAVEFEVRAEIANVCQQMADKYGEPPL